MVYTPWWYNAKKRKCKPKIMSMRYCFISNRSGYTIISMDQIWLNECEWMWMIDSQKRLTGLPLAIQPSFSSDVEPTVRLLQISFLNQAAGSWPKTQQSHWSQTSCEWFAFQGQLLGVRWCRCCFLAAVLWGKFLKSQEISGRLVAASVFETVLQFFEV